MLRVPGRVTGAPRLHCHLLAPGSPLLPRGAVLGSLTVSDGCGLSMTDATLLRQMDLSARARTSDPDA